MTRLHGVRIKIVIGMEQTLRTTGAQVSMIEREANGCQQDTMLHTIKP